MKIQHLLITALFLLLSLQLFADDASRDYRFKDVDKVEVGSNIKIDFVLGDEEKATARGSNKILERFVAEQDGSTLKFFLKGKTLMSWNNDEVRIKLSLKNLEHLRMSGASHFNAEALELKAFSADLSGATQLKIGRLSGDNIKLSGSGSSHFNFDALQADKLKVDLSGACHISISDSGKVDHQSLHLSGSSNVDTQVMQSEVTEVHASGSSNIKVNVQEHLKGSLSGASQVGYKGRPALSVHTSGASHTYSL